MLSQRTYRSTLSVNEAGTGGNRDFKILVENKANGRHCVHLVAPTVQDKEAWMSDVSQCIDNIHLHTMLSPTHDRASMGGLCRRKKMSQKSIFVSYFCCCFLSL